MVSYIGGYQCRASLWCPHNIYASSTYCNLLCFFRAPSLILILSIRQALFSRSRGRGRGGWRVWGTRFNFMTCSATVCMFFMYNDQDQFLLPRNGPSNLILDCVAIWQFLVMNLSEYRTMQYWNRIALLHPYFVNQWRRLFFVQFCNFTIFVQFLIGRC